MAAGMAASLPILDACAPSTGGSTTPTVSTPQPSAPTGGITGPNILILMTDQERSEVALPSGFSLPARAMLRSSGVHFARHHTPTAPCSPARSTFFTGLHSPVSGIRDNCGLGQPDLSTDIATLGTVLKAAGYRTAYVGKWHLTGTTTDVPSFLQPYGFDEAIGLSGNGVPNGGATEDPPVAAAASAWIAARSGDPQPWCLVVSLINPHDMMWCPRFYRLDEVPDHGAAVPGNFETDLASKPAVQTLWRAENVIVGGAMPNDVTSNVGSGEWRKWGNWYLELLRRTDDLISSVLASLTSSGLAGETVVVQVADHGEMGGGHGLRQKGAMIYQENLRVPLTICDPRRPATHGATTTSLTSHVDIVPTIAALAGFGRSELPWLTGHDLTPLLDSPQQRVREALLVTSDAPSSGLAVPGLNYCIRGAITEQHSFGRYSTTANIEQHADDDELECYDRSADPGEMHNLAHDAGSAAVLADLDALVDELVASELADLP